MEDAIDLLGFLLILPFLLLLLLLFLLCINSPSPAFSSLFQWTVLQSRCSHKATARYNWQLTGRVTTWLG